MIRATEHRTPVAASASEAGPQRAHAPGERSGLVQTPRRQPASAQHQAVGWWSPPSAQSPFDAEALRHAAREIRAPVHLVLDTARGYLGTGLGGSLGARAGTGLPCVGVLPPVYPEWLGDRSFGQMHAVRFPYIAGAMARGIASTTLVAAMAEAGMLAFFGAAGLPLVTVERALVELGSRLRGRSWGCNVIHTPNEPAWEAGLVDLLLRHGVLLGKLLVVSLALQLAVWSLSALGLAGWSGLAALVVYGIGAGITPVCLFAMPSRAAGQGRVAASASRTAPGYGPRS